MSRRNKGFWRPEMPTHASSGEASFRAPEMRTDQGAGSECPRTREIEVTKIEESSRGSFCSTRGAPPAMSKHKTTTPKRKAEGNVGGEPPPKRTRGSEAPRAEGAPHGSAREETSQPVWSLEIPLPSSLHLAPPRPVSGSLIYRAWKKDEFREGPWMFKNREFDGFVCAGTEHGWMFRAPYTTAGNGIYMSDFVGQFSASQGYVTAQVVTKFTPWSRAASPPTPSATTLRPTPLPCPSNPGLPAAPPLLPVRGAAPREQRS